MAARREGSVIQILNGLEKSSPNPSLFLVEAGESRTPLSADQNISDKMPEVPFIFTNIAMESSFRQTFGISNLEDHLFKLLPMLLDQFIVLGQTAQQFKQAIGNNDHCLDQITETPRFNFEEDICNKSA